MHKNQPGIRVKVVEENVLGPGFTSNQQLLVPGFTLQPELSFHSRYGF